MKKNTTKMFAAVLLALTMGLSLSAQAFAVVHNWENGETIDDTYYIPDIDKDGISAVVTADPADDSNTCLFIDDQTPDAANDTVLPIGEITEKTTIEFDVRFTAVTTGIIAITEGDVQANDANMGLRFIFRAAGTLCAINGATEVVVGEYTADEWYNIKFVMDPAVKKYSIAINDEVVIEDADWYSLYEGAEVLDSIAFGVVKSANGGLYIDNIKANEKEIIPEETELVVETAAVVETEAETVPAAETEAVMAPAEQVTAPQTFDLVSVVLVLAAVSGTVCGFAGKRKVK